MTQGHSPARRLMARRPAAGSDLSFLWSFQLGKQLLSSGAPFFVAALRQRPDEFIEARVRRGRGGRECESGRRRMSARLQY